MTRLAWLLALLLCLLALSGCGSDDEREGSGASATSTSTATGDPAAAAFPADVEHKFGTTTVEKELERIVVVGLTEQDTVLALGYEPIATTE